MLPHICKQCGAVFQGGPRAYYCPDCRIDRQRAQNRAYKQRKRQGLVRELGSTDKCVRCGANYTVTGPNQRFCPECALIHAREHDQRTSLAHYHQYKHRLNPVRNKRRRKGPRKCAWCNKPFLSPGKRTRYCSPECKRQAINTHWRKRYYTRQATTQLK